MTIPSPATAVTTEMDGAVAVLSMQSKPYNLLDDRLTIEFNGKRPCVCALEISKADDVPTLYLLGDSTVADQSRESFNSWGQMLTRFFKPASQLRIIPNPANHCAARAARSVWKK